LPGEATTGGDKALQISRETDRGIEVVRVTLPAVVTADLRLCEPRYASLPSILKARKKPIERIDFDELDVPLDPKVRILEFRTAAAARTCEMVQDAEQLADRIRRRWKTDSSCAF
jgi:electron transfer flavoprotein beta subunit